MSYNTKPIITDVGGNPISQYYDPITDTYKPVEGNNGGNKVTVENNDLSLIPILDELEDLNSKLVIAKGEKGEKGDKGDYATPVVNNLTSTSTTSALSANQGKVLKDGLDAVTLQSNDIATDVEKLKPKFVRLDTLSVDISIPNDTLTPVPWGTSSNSLYWSSANPTKLLIPSGVSKVVVKASVYWDPSTVGSRTVNVVLNSAGYRGEVTEFPTESIRFGQVVVTPILNVAQGDVIECVVRQSSGGALNIAGTWQPSIVYLEMEVVE